jgi:hypothetical protein
MPAHMSNSDRIARAAAEVEAATAEKAAKKAAAPKTPRKSRARAVAKAPQKFKVVWAVGRTGAEPVKSFPYKERAAADAEAARIGKGCVVNPLKVPME